MSTKTNVIHTLNPCNSSHSPLPPSTDGIVYIIPGLFVHTSPQTENTASRAHAHRYPLKSCTDLYTLTTPSTVGLRVFGVAYLQAR